MADTAEGSQLPCVSHTDTGQAPTWGHDHPCQDFSKKKKEEEKEREAQKKRERENARDRF